MKKLLSTCIFVLSFYSLTTAQFYNSGGLLLGYRSLPTTLNQQAYTLQTFEIGIAATGGYTDIENFMGIPIAGEWEYYGLPFISFDWKYKSDMNYHNWSRLTEAPRYMLNLGVTAGKGLFFTILPAGLNASVAYSTDFKDSFMRFGLGYDVCHLSLNSGLYWNMTKRGPAPKYMSGVYVEIRLFLWDGE